MENHFHSYLRTDENQRADMKNFSRMTKGLQKLQNKHTEEQKALYNRTKTPVRKLIHYVLYNYRQFELTMNSTLHAFNSQIQYITSHT